MNYRAMMRALVVALLVGVCAVALAACGSSDDGGSETTSRSSDGGAATASMAEAREAIAPFVGRPSPFPVTEPLRERPVGARVVYMDPGTPIGALLYELLRPAADAMGFELSRVKAGSSPATINAAYSAVAEQKPDAVIDCATDPALFRPALAKLRAAGIPVLSNGVVDHDKFGLAGGVFGRESAEESGKLLADYVYAEHGEDTNVVFYFMPELAFAPVTKDAFIAEMEKLCPDCTARELSLSVATIANKMPSEIVSDLQSHPDTKTVVTATTEMLTGVPAALKVAGIDVETTGSGGGPANLEMVKAGQQTSGLFVDYPVMMWMLADMVARTITRQEITPEQAKGIPPKQFMRQEDITFDPTRGWTGYPDFADRFKQLWGVG